VYQPSIGSLQELCQLDGGAPVRVATISSQLGVIDDPNQWKENKEAAVRIK